MKTKTFYKFESKHLGEAFLQELLELGYKNIGASKEVTNSFNYILHDKKDGEGIYLQSCIAFEADYEFTLEADWNEALAFAKEQISKPEFEIGEWVVLKDGRGTTNDPLRIKKLASNIDGFIFDRHVTNASQSSAYLSWIERKATKDEIESALIKEAERRYNVGEVVKFLDGKERELQGFSLLYNPKNDSLTATGIQGDVRNRKDVLYQNGKWAEIIENTKFFDWDVEYKSDGIHFAPDCSDGVYWNKVDIAHIIRNLKQLDQNLTIGDLRRELKKLDL